MAMQFIEFQFITGLKRPIFRNARLRGSWDVVGRYSDTWTDSSMIETLGEDGCPMFTATVQLDLQDVNRTFKWGVMLDGPQGANFWGIPTEVPDIHSSERYREFRLRPSRGDGQVERYYLTYNRRLGANKYFKGGGSHGLRFAVWAPHARAVDVVFGDPSKGYIADDGTGIDHTKPAIPLSKDGDNIWASAPQPDFTRFAGAPYMYRILNAQGRVVYRTDIFSRHQIGRGAVDPATDATWPGTIDTLDGTKSCSVIVDPDTVTRDFVPPAAGPTVLIPVEDFWASEFTAGLHVASHVEDLIVYELHVGSLGVHSPGPGTLSDAMVFLDHLVSLGINAVELLPLAEFSGNVAWGYGDSHHFCIESSAGGRYQYKHFVRECHRRGIAVIQDVVYNHYDNNAERAQWQYDSADPEQNIYYWYEGHPSDYTDSAGGYLDNGSSGYTPRFSEEVVRQGFISSAAFLIEEMHVDGLRVDLTQAIHRDNALHKDGSPVQRANVFGQKLLREWSRTLHMIRPNVILIAEDHSGWPAVTQPPPAGGLGFDATWFADFYHNLIGDSDMAAGKARLLKQAGYGTNEPLAMNEFARLLYDTRHNKIVYHESHDEAGNSGGTARTMVTAVNGAPLWSATRMVAEARSRLSFGLSLLSAGTPMFLMGEEVGAQKPYTYNHFINHREDILGERHANGARMFRYYQDLITLSRRLRSIRGHNIDILHQSNDNRLVAFKRWNADEEVIIIASFNNAPFGNGYVIEKDTLAIPHGFWKEIFNSDAAVYGGLNVGNAGASIPSSNGRLEITKVPANALLLFVKQ